MWDKRTGLCVMYLCRVGGVVGALGGVVGATCGEDQRDAVPGSIPKLWINTCLPFARMSIS